MTMRAHELILIRITRSHEATKSEGHLRGAPVCETFVALREHSLWLRPEATLGFSCRPPVLPGFLYFSIEPGYNPTG
jgi:hypothetical protein